MFERCVPGNVVSLVSSSETESEDPDTERGPPLSTCQKHGNDNDTVNGKNFKWCFVCKASAIPKLSPDSLKWITYERVTHVYWPPLLANVRVSFSVKDEFPLR